MPASLPRHRQGGGPLEDLRDVHEVGTGLARLEHLRHPGDRELRAVRRRSHLLRDDRRRRRAGSRRSGPRPRSSPARRRRSSRRTAPGRVHCSCSRTRGRLVRHLARAALSTGALRRAPLRWLHAARNRRAPHRQRRRHSYGPSSPLLDATGPRAGPSVAADSTAPIRRGLSPRTDGCHGMSTRSSSTTSRYMTIPVTETTRIAAQVTSNAARWRAADHHPARGSRSGRRSTRRPPPRSGSAWSRSSARSGRTAARWGSAPCAVTAVGPAAYERISSQAEASTWVRPRSTLIMIGKKTSAAAIAIFESGLRSRTSCWRSARRR